MLKLWVFKEYFHLWLLGKEVSFNKNEQQEEEQKDEAAFTMVQFIGEGETDALKGDFDDAY